ncbi:MAG: ANTAR domain-containing protein [Eubacterium sp.]|nr:ANTAR domain-containing protein [Eubacterium sp.]
MAGNSRMQYSLLMVSSSEQFNILTKKALPSGLFNVIETRKSASGAKREVLERNYDIIIINAPLMDEMGTDFVLGLQDKINAGILMITPAEISGNVTEMLIDYGVIVLAKPLKASAVNQAVRMLVANQKKLKDAEKRAKKAEEKLTELKLINRAKLLLIQSGMNEEEAEKYIIKEAMDRGLKKKTVAVEIIEDHN